MLKHGAGCPTETLSKSTGLGTASRLQRPNRSAPACQMPMNARMCSTRVGLVRAVVRYLQ